MNTVKLEEILTNLDSLLKVAKTKQARTAIYDTIDFIVLSLL